MFLEKPGVCLDYDDKLFKKEVYKMKAYCVKCKMKKEMIKEKKVKSKTGRNMVQGVCPKCGTNMNIFVK